MERRSLTDRQKAVLALLDRENKVVHPAFVARILDGPGKSGAGWSSTLRALVRMDLVRSDYALHGMERFEITDKGRETLRN